MHTGRMLRLFGLVLLAACSKAGSTRGHTVLEGDENAGASREEVADLDDLSTHDARTIVVDFVDGTTQAEIDALEKGFGVDLEPNDSVESKASGITIGAVVSAEEMDDVLARIRADSHVEAAEPLVRYSASMVPNDPLFAKQWNLKQIHAPEAWDTARGKGVVVAVIDTGIAWENHGDFAQVPDFEGARFVPGYDFVNDDAHANDDHGHGTHVAGTIAQSTNNRQGVAGVAFEATLMPIKVLDHFGSGNSADIAEAIRWAVDNGAKVLNLSLGGGGRSEVLANAVAYAKKKGAVVVCAAGNSGRAMLDYPAAYAGAFAVAAVGPQGARAPYSNYGKGLKLAAPGGDKSQGEEGGIWQNTIDPQSVGQSIYASYQGTSMAAPHVAGVAALLFSAGAPNAERVEQAMLAGVSQGPKGRGWTPDYGQGLLDAQGALQALKSGASVENLMPEAVAPVEAVTEVSAVTSVSDVRGFSPFDYKPFAWALAFLAFVLLTLTKKERPGYLNILLRPGFFLPLMVTTVGVVAARLFEANSMSTALSLPLPEWLFRIIFGRGTLASPVVYSAAIPLVLSLFAIPMRGLRQMVGGLSLGFAGFLAYTIWARTPPLSWLPITYMAIPWLMVNVGVCLFIARAMLRKSEVA